MFKFTLGSSVRRLIEDVLHPTTSVFSVKIYIKTEGNRTFNLMSNDLRVESVTRVFSIALSSDIFQNNWEALKDSCRKIEKQRNNNRILSYRTFAQVTRRLNDCKADLQERTIRLQVKMSFSKSRQESVANSISKTVDSQKFEIFSIASHMKKKGAVSTVLIN